MATNSKTRRLRKDVEPAYGLSRTPSVPDEQNKNTRQLPSPCVFCMDKKNDLTLVDRCDAGEFLAFEELEHGTTAGGYIAYFIGITEFVHRCNAVAATYE